MAYPFHLDPHRRADEESIHERRTYGRRRQESLKSTLGVVLDISRGGMRVRGRKPAKDLVDDEESFEVVLISLEGELTLQARVAWSRRLGFRRHEIGIEFVDLNEEQADRLAEISTIHRLNYDETA